MINISFASGALRNIDVVTIFYLFFLEIISQCSFQVPIVRLCIGLIHKVCSLSAYQRSLLDCPLCQLLYCCYINTLKPTVKSNEAAFDNKNAGTVHSLFFHLPVSLYLQSSPYYLSRKGPGGETQRKRGLIPSCTLPVSHYSSHCGYQLAGVGVIEGKIINIYHTTGSHTSTPTLFSTSSLFVQLPK